MCDCLVGRGTLDCTVRHPVGLSRPDEGVCALRVLLPVIPLSAHPTAARLMTYLRADVSSSYNDKGEDEYM